MGNQWYSTVVLFAVIIAFTAMVMGAYTRLNQAGLGCAEWPACYGHIAMTDDVSSPRAKELGYPGVPSNSANSWLSRVRHYFVFALALLVFMLTVWTIAEARQFSVTSYVIVAILNAVIVLQTLIGMWAVAWQSFEFMVMAHLLGSITILALLWLLYAHIRIGPSNQIFANRRYLKLAVMVGILLLSVQIISGGWTSANYAAVVCPDFPYCHGQLFPDMDWRRGFNFLNPVGGGYDQGIWNSKARVAIHMMHRYLAVLTTAYLFVLAGYAWMSRKCRGLMELSALLAGFVIMQFTLGYLNVVQLLRPNYIPVAHNGMSALMMLTLITMYVKLNNVSHDRIKRGMNGAE